VVNRGGDKRPVELLPEN